VSDTVFRAHLFSLERTWLVNVADSAGRPSGVEPRVWPAVVIFAVQAVFFVLSITPSINNALRFGFMLLGPAIGLLLLLGWLILASRLPWIERFTYLLVMAAMAAGISLLLHPTVAFGLVIYGVPLCTLALPTALMLVRRTRRMVRVAWVALALGVVWGPFLLLRIDGFDGRYLPEFAWRWSQTDEESLMAEATAVAQGPDESWEPQEALWPGFRGPQRNSRVDDLATPLDWTSSPPRELWRISIGPAWSSFAHVSGRLYTQEQRGEDEAVSCYDAETGNLIWMHTDQVRFTEIVSGAGPRATPTFADGNLFTFGSKALLSCLDPATGELLWQRDLMKEVNAELPVWGFSSSPLIVDDLAIVYAGGEGEHGLVAYHTRTGEPVWQMTSRGMNFSSAQPMTLDGQRMVVFGDSDGVVAVDPATGSALWRYAPSNWEGPAICQPQQVGPASFIVPLGDGVGVARLDVARDGDDWNVRERWSSKRLRPSFNDFVYHEGALFGFDQSIFVCLDAETGQRNWKRGRYGFGQVVLLAASGQMIVTTESGQLVLLNCNAEKLEEQGRVDAVSGKTWNHPVLVGNRLFVRNASEAVCYGLL
jgi:outer membrane protein assembly factor BamB